MTQVTSRSRAATRAVRVDATIAKAVDQAREAAERRAGDFGVGEHVGTIVEDERVLTHLFECPHPGYRGWRWAVTMSRALRGRNVTVNEVVLIPGDDSLLAPEWVPWRDRVRAAWSLVIPVVSLPPTRIRLSGLPPELWRLSWGWAVSVCCRGRAVTPPLSVGSPVRVALTTP